MYSKPNYKYKIVIACPILHRVSVFRHESGIRMVLK